MRGLSNRQTTVQRIRAVRRRQHAFRKGGKRVPVSRRGSRKGHLPALALCGSLCLAGAGRVAECAPSFAVEAEAGYVHPARMDVRIPGDSGTDVSLTGDLRAGGKPAGRLRLTAAWSERHRAGVLAAPLQLEAAGEAPRRIAFTDAVFEKGTPLAAEYKFNSYRFFYLCTLHRSERLEFALGGTGKVRDAHVRLTGGGRDAISTDLGFVPLVGFDVAWRPAPGWRLRAEGDALAAPQGRAEDVRLAVQRDISPHATLSAGYRVLEGGADNDAVYTFAWFNYAVLALQWRL
ncbi:MAG: hypothetical protein FJ225_11505 [Lentisphaerae bacterium]|nr:hypothetical protein [Lentisphaerota bacterium]